MNKRLFYLICFVICSILLGYVIGKIIIIILDSRIETKISILTYEQRVSLLEMNIVCVKNATYNNLDYKEICVYSPELTKEIKKRLQ